MKRKIFILLILVLACSFCFLFLVFPELEYREKRISDVINIKTDDITKIEMMDGRDMSRCIILEDKESINKFMNLLNDDVIRKVKPPPSNTWLYISSIYL